MTKQLRVFSYGGGVQSTACLVLASQGRIDFPHLSLPMLVMIVNPPPRSSMYATTPFRSRQHMHTH